MDWISIYKQNISARSEWKMQHTGRSIYELGEAFDQCIPSAVKLQELSLPRLYDFVNCIANKPTLSQGSVVVRLVYDIYSAVNIEITALWASPWLALKTVSMAMVTMPPALTLPTVPVSTFTISNSTYGPHISIISETTRQYLTLLYTKYNSSTLSSGAYTCPIP